jgi:hypothetical protein
LYRFHAWFGRDVFVHAVIDKAGGAVFRCTLDGSDADRWLEIPAWMFDRAACPDTTLKSVPFVSFGALQALSTLLDQALRRRAASSNASFCAVSRVSRSENRREAHGREDGSEDRVDEGRPPLRTAGQHASDGSVQRGSGRRRGGDATLEDLPQDAQAALIGLMTQLMPDSCPAQVAEASHDL